MRLWSILTKELVDGLRDRRAMLSSMSFPVLSPLMTVVILSTMIARMDPDEQDPDGGDPELAVVGIEHAPSLVAWLDKSGLNPVPFEGSSPEEAVEEGDEKIVLRISEGYAEDWQAGRPARVELIIDRSREDAQKRRSKVEGAVTAWGWSVGTRRLMALGIAPDLIRPLAIEKVDISTPEQRGARVLMLIPMFIIMACFICSMYVAIDVTAGERERGSLEPLVLTTATPHELGLAKCGAAFIFGLFGVTLTAVISLWVLRFVDLSALGVKVAAGPREMWMFVLVCIPLTALAAAAQVLLATFSRSFKEAQTYLSMMIFVPMLPGFLMTLGPVDEATWMMTLPAHAQQLMLGKVLQGEGLAALDYGVSLLSSILLTTLLVWACGKLLQKEGIIFGR